VPYSQDIPDPIEVASLSLRLQIHLSPTSDHIKERFEAHGVGQWFVSFIEILIRFIVSGVGITMQKIDVFYDSCHVEGELRGYAVVT
jgi:hypothetical protein